MPELLITGASDSTRSFQGIGVEADAYVFDDINRACGVTDADLELIERRVNSLRPSLTRMFVEVGWFNPDLDGVNFTWDAQGYVNLIRQLRLLREVGALVNLVLFMPTPSPNVDMQPVVGAMLTLLERLASREGLDNIRWLTLWNEPDSLFYHDSPLYRRIFGEDSASNRPPWSDYVRINRLAYREMIDRGVYPHTKLVVADTVWGAPMRGERMRMSLEAFGDLDVSYSYHNYSPEDLSHYDGKRDYAYSGMGVEAKEFRDLLGPQRELILWEFNTPGLAGFGSMFAGVGPGGTDQVSTIEGAVDVAGKVLLAAANGVDGFCLWCLHDMIYCRAMDRGVMPFGLWRFQWQHWLPRPIYHYYGAICRAFRSGGHVVRTQGDAPRIASLAIRYDNYVVVALLNQSGAPVTATLRGVTGDRLTRSRVCPYALPVESDLPFYEEQTLTTTRGAIDVDLEVNELTIIKA